jgi:predicted ATPase/class 3 adenylate cyclase
MSLDARPLRGWLAALGLEQYAELLESNRVDLDILPALTEHDLQELGIPLGDRKRLLKAVADRQAAAATAGDERPRPSPATEVTSSPRTGQAADGERRQLTVLFCDLVESTALARRLDPEEYREVVRGYQAAGAEVVQRLEGHIAQYLGDGLLVYFGYPQAHEDDAARAVRAGLEIVTAVARLNERPGTRVALAVRIGIHTGPVVVGDMGAGDRHERLALGDTPNIAARLQGLAEASTVLVSGATHRLVDGAFRFENLGSHTLKGVDDPVPVYRVLGESEWRGRLDAQRRLTRLVGREQEVGLLLDRWERAAEGQGQAVLVMGEPGIGKSRAVRALRERLAGEPHRWLEARCSPYYTHTPLQPIIEVLSRLWGRAPEAAADGGLEALETWLRSLEIDPAEALPLLALLLSRPAPEGYPLPPMSPERQRRRTLETVVAVVLALTGEQPLVLVVEDLHWVDPTTLELLGQLIDQAPTARLLLLLTARPEFPAPWAARSYLTPLGLNRLTRRQTEQVVDHLAGGRALPREVAHEIVAKTDGVPLFIEELTKTVLESGPLETAGDGYRLAGPLRPLAIPTTLQDSLMARLDRLGRAKDVAQLGATLGRTFRYAWLRAVFTGDEPALQAALAQLVEGELLFQRGVPPEATYTFKHALIQDAAYQSLLRRTRQQYHQRIAQVIEAQFPETVGTQPELLAHHYTEASLLTQAIGHWHRAGERAIGRSAYVEAISHFTRGLDLLQALPETPERIEREYALQMALGVSLMNTRGYAAPEVEPVFRRARQLAQQTADTPMLVSVLYGLWIFHVTRADYRAALELGNEAFGLAQRVQDPALLVVAHGMLDVAFLYSGDIVEALDHCERGAALYDRQQHRFFVSSCGKDLGVEHRVHAAVALWFLGYPDRGRARMREAIMLAQELCHPFSLVFCQLVSASQHFYRREVQSTLERARASITIASEQGFAFPLAMATFLEGWALTEEGHIRQGLTQMRQAQASLKAGGAEVITSYFLIMIAEAHGKLGQTDAGLTALADAGAFVQKSNERLWEAELHRIRGELLWRAARQGRIDASLTQQGPGRAGGADNGRSDPEACFQQAIDVARRQRARSLELRAALSLSRLWREQGKTEEARRLLAEIHGWFTEGFDTPDLQAAKALLDELAT